MWPHYEAHSNDLQHHLNAENCQENVVQNLGKFVLFSCWIFSSQYDTVSNNGSQDDLVKPWVDYDFDDFLSERIRHCAAA